VDKYTKLFKPNEQILECSYCLESCGSLSESDDDAGPMLVKLNSEASVVFAIYVFRILCRPHLVSFLSKNLVGSVN